MSAAGRVDLMARTGDLRTLEAVASPAAPALAAPGRVRLRIDRFALTANNVTYAVFGDAPGMTYWRFFPAPPGRGRVPVWGFADVTASTHPEVSVGERFYGFWPMSTDVDLEPQRAGSHGFVDGAPHRAGLAAVYNAYLRERPRPDGSDAERRGAEAEQMLLRPLFGTSFLIDDFLADEGCFGARRVVLSSASSKTAYGTAFLLARRGPAGGPEVVGLTSPGNRAFVERLGCYARVLGYDEVAALDASIPTVYVDFAGDAPLRAALHRHLGEALRHDCAVGAAHWQQLRAGDASRAQPLPGPPPTLFFAPARWARRTADWGEAGLAQRMGEARRAFAQRLHGSGAWLTVVEHRGPATVARVWRDLVDGRSRPDEGHVLSLDDA